MLRKVINLKEGLKLTCGARARSVEAREIVGAAAGSDAGRVGGERGERSAWRRSDDESGRAGRAQRTREAGGDVRVRFGAGWNVLGRPGRLWTGLGLPGPVWTGLGRFRRSGPDLDWQGGPGDLDRTESARTGPAWTGSGLGAIWSGLGWSRLGGLAWSGRRGPAQAGSADPGRSG